MIQIIALRKFGDKNIAAFPGTNVPVGSIGSVFKKTVDILSQLDESEHYNLFYTLAHHTGTSGAKKPVREVATFEYQTVIAFDIDDADTGRAFDYAEEVSQVLLCPRTHLRIVNSGNGIHIIANLIHPIQRSSYFYENKVHYNEICSKIQKRLREMSPPLPGKVDPVIFEPARILRLPGTVNKKEGKLDRACELIQDTDAAIDLDLPKLSGLENLAKENISPEEIKRNYPKPDLQEMMKECRYLTWTLENPGEVHEPNFFDQASLLACQPESTKVMFKGLEYTPEGLARYTFDKATASASLAKSDFQEKWDQAKRYGGRKCATIKGNYSKACLSCPHDGKIVSPLSLKSKKHIASASNGYWVLGANGKQLYPNYEDLSKVFKEQMPYVTTSDERIMVWNEPVLKPFSPINVKGWLESTVNPPDPLREMHRNEFIYKLKAKETLSPEEEQKLLIDSIKGKISCKNGVVDIKSSRLIPHSMDMGFRYSLPYDYVPNKKSQIFLDWLDTITEGVSDLKESLLDIMAYVLWPDFNDHMFVYLTGDGANGKSTYMNIIKAVVGKENSSSISMQQLTQNRFAPSLLDGKMVNLSEESSGITLGSEELNMLKNLSSGGELIVEQKGKQGFNMINQAKLIFSANKYPKFVEQGHSITRRLISIPFNYTIKTPDHRVEDRIKADAPNIMSMLVSRIQNILEVNDGQFKVFRGGAAAEAEKRKVMSAGSTVCDWASQNLSASDEYTDRDFLIISEIYNEYVLWCKPNGHYYPANAKTFGSMMKQNVLSKKALTEDGQTSIKTVGEKRVKVYTHIRRKSIEEMIG